MEAEVLIAAERVLRGNPRAQLIEHWSPVLGVRVEILDLGVARLPRDSPRARAEAVARALREEREAWVSWVDGPSEELGRALLARAPYVQEIHPALPALRTSAGIATRRLSVVGWTRVVCAELLGEREEELLTCYEHHPPGSWMAASALREVEGSCAIEVSAGAAKIAEVVLGLRGGGVPGGAVDLAQSMSPQVMTWVVEEGFALAQCVLAEV